MMTKIKSAKKLVMLNKNEQNFILSEKAHNKV